jgi:hypothetical protein
MVFKFSLCDFATLREIINAQMFKKIESISAKKSFTKIRQKSNDGKPSNGMNKNAFDVTDIRIKMSVCLNTCVKETDWNQQKHKNHSEVGCFGIAWKKHVQQIRRGNIYNIKSDCYGFFGK